MANICRTKHDRDNRANIGSTKALLRCPKISWTLAHKRLKTGPESLSTVTILFCPSQSHTLYAALTVAPHSDSKWNATGFVCSSNSKPPKDVKIGNVIPLGGLKWQYVAIIATFLADLCFARILFLFRHQISELAERNSTISGHMVGSTCNLQTHVQNLGYPVPYESVVQNHLFGRLCSLRATLTAYIVGIKHDMRKRQVHGK